MSKVAVITGASRGVGLEICRRLAAHNWLVVGFARRADQLSAAKKEIGENFSHFSVDVQKSDQVASAFANLGRTFGKIDLLVNNAAIFKMAKFTDCTAADVDSLIDTNLKGTIFCTLEALKIMKSGARIINIASVAANHGIRNQALYCASKFAVDGFAEALNQEVIEMGISLTTICPGGVDTPLWNKGNPYPGDVRQLLKPEDVASAVEYAANLPERVVLKKLTMFPSNEWH